MYVSYIMIVMFKLLQNCKADSLSSIFFFRIERLFFEAWFWDPNPPTPQSKNKSDKRKYKYYHNYTGFQFYFLIIRQYKDKI